MTDDILAQMLAGATPPWIDVQMRVVGGSASMLDFDPDLFRTVFDRRRDSIATHAFALPCMEAVETILADRRPLVEVGAGTGFWSAVLAAHGADVIATDACADPVSGYRQRIGAHHPVERMDAAQAVARYPDRDVLMVWPCYNDPWAAEAVQLITQPGRRLCYIGEGPGGCTGDDALHHLIEGPTFRETASVRIPQWPGLHDGLRVYERTITQGEPHGA